MKKKKSGLIAQGPPRGGQLRVRSASADRASPASSDAKSTATAKAAGGPLLPTPKPLLTSQDVGDWKLKGGKKPVVPRKPAGPKTLWEGTKAVTVESSEDSTKIKVKNKFDVLDIEDDMEDEVEDMWR